jgi:hypothetical protein
MFAVRRARGRWLALEQISLGAGERDQMWTPAGMGTLYLTFTACLQSRAAFIETLRSPTAWDIHEALEKQVVKGVRITSLIMASHCNKVTLVTVYWGWRGEQSTRTVHWWWRCLRRPSRQPARIPVNFSAFSLYVTMLVWRTRTSRIAVLRGRWRKHQEYRWLTFVCHTLHLFRRSTCQKRK